MLCRYVERLEGERNVVVQQLKEEKDAVMQQLQAARLVSHRTECSQEHMMTSSIMSSCALGVVNSMFDSGPKHVVVLAAATGGTQE